MRQQPFDRWEEQVRTTASAFPYPPTPDVTGAVLRRLATEPRGRRRIGILARTAVALAVILAVLLAVPPVRAALLDILRIGAVRILPAPVPDVATPVRGSSPTPQPGTAITSGSPTVVPTLPAVSGLELSGEITLPEARERVAFPIQLPAHPPDLGPPDRVFVERFGGSVVVLVWQEPRADRVRLALYELGPGVSAQKVAPRVVRETSVNGHRAVWGEGAHLFRLLGGGPDEEEYWRVVESNVLIWEEGGVTYRLETRRSLKEAVTIAESLR